ncbi:MAG TPA: hypothetical protein VIF57_19670 [Polyangia bacterium]|jgi:hypothetical protein
MPFSRLATVVQLAALLALAACTPDVPDAPTYTKDVQPILEAHCVRCHGANDTLNPDPTVPYDLKMPIFCYLQRYDDEGCETQATCKHGAGYCGSTASGNLILTEINTLEGDLRMPPLPADRLNDWEMEVLTRWSGDNPAR